MSRTVLITGGRRGIGPAIAQACQCAGDRVSTTRRTTPAPNGSVPGDITPPDEAEAVFAVVEEQHGLADARAPNAGTTRGRMPLTMPEDDFSSVRDSLGLLRAGGPVQPHRLQNGPERLPPIPGTRAALCLASLEAAYITGQVLAVDRDAPVGN
ncbi:SDR family NAD(P)-dependent oxidoreductase [Kitasatospora indigofera]|uniref:SDR family NAD(P)-dependent oxidoreductase n=1 Tax=Kitasatospora indigofera TaxID=67307 RepID=UPI0033B547FF